MKKVLFAAMAAAVIVSCDKKNDETVTTETTTTTTEAPATVVDTVQVDTVVAGSTTDATTAATTTPAASNNDSAEVISTSTYEGDGKKATASYMGDQAGKMSVKVTVDGKDYVLPQTEAWAKGGVYSDGKIEFTNKGQTNEAELKMDGKTYKMKEVK